VYPDCRMFKLIAFIVVIPATVVVLAGSELPSSNSIPRFHMMADGVFRGGQPDKKGFAFLKRQGVKTIINLRMENDEEAIVKQLGMNYIQIAIDDPKPWSKIPDQAITKYFEVLNDPANYPVFFHCRRGADRTGALAALYRIAKQGWDARKAYDEARDIGLRWWYSAIKDQVFEFKPLPAAKSVPRILATERQ